jgi:DNA-binding NarL/FixJ family response regulator
MPSSPKKPKRGQPLSARETEILLLICDGLIVKQIGAALNISPKTVEFHKHELFDKLGLRSTAELVRYAVRRGLIEP